MDTIKLNTEQKLYVIPCGGGYSCLGFDVADKWARAAANEMQRPDLLPKSKPGTLRHYAEYVRTIDAARELNARTGRRLNYELTPQLIGLENKRVEVVDCYGETRRFYVGKSTGFIPCHLEISRRNSHGGPAVMGAPFKAVRVVGQR